ncbi:MAG: HAD family hydrolase [Coriobacteriia bacterium]|nr:HAD family hydrolase [Coriobacteriia bacterium]
MSLPVFDNQTSHEEFHETSSIFTPKHSFTPDNPVKIAAMDFDGTLISGQSGAELFKFLISRRMINIGKFIKVAWWGIRYKLRLPVEQSEVREDIFSLFKGMSSSEVTDLMQKFYLERLKKLYMPGAIKELELLEQLGYYIVIVSASFYLVVMPAAEHLHVDAVLATNMQQTDDGEGFTGKVLGAPVEGREKVNAIHKFADEKFGPNNWVLERAYGDHYTDAYMLEAARQGFAVEPDVKLEKRAQTKGWPILHWSES